MSDNFPSTGVKLALRYRRKRSTFIAPGCVVNRVKVNCCVTSKKNGSFQNLKLVQKYYKWVGVLSAHLMIIPRCPYNILRQGVHFIEKKTL